MGIQSQGLKGLFGKKYVTIPYRDPITNCTDSKLAIK